MDKSKTVKMKLNPYDGKFSSNHLTYKDCTVCKEWLNFQIFSEWFDENYYSIDNKRICLDKDILIKDNKIYSPETCVFAPQNINNRSNYYDER